MTQPIGGTSAYALCLLEILKEYSDSDHPLTYAEIIAYMKKEYGIEPGRNTIGRMISLLREIGYDISTYNDTAHDNDATHDNKKKGTYLDERPFENVELLALIDSVRSSRYIPEKRAKELIEKLGGLSSRYFRKKIPHVDCVSEWVHQRNQEFLLSLEILSEAIENKKQVAFTYNRAGVDGELHPVRDTKDRVHPYALVCTGGQYYLIGSYQEYDNVLHYRVDRMLGVELLKEQDAKRIEEITGYKHGLDIGKYAREHNFMYGGKAERIVLKMRSDCASDVLDTFGQSAEMEAIDDEFMKVTVHAALEGMRYFALQFGTVCEVISPAALREMVKEDAREIARKYGLFAEGTEK